jgi:hypothetical protein
LGAELHQRPHGRFFNSSALGKRAVARPSGAAPDDLAGIAELPGYVRCSREGQKEKSRCFVTVHKPCQMCKKKIIAAHVTRW